MLKELRDQLRHDLETGSDGAATPVGVPVIGPYPDRVVAPCLVLGQEPTAYVSAGETFGQEYRLKFVVVLLVSRSDNYLNELESLVELVLANTADWGLSGVDAPGVVTMSGQELLGCVVHIEKLALLKGATP